MSTTPSKSLAPVKIEPVRRWGRNETLAFVACGGQRSPWQQGRVDGIGRLAAARGVRMWLWRARRGKALVAATLVVEQPGRVGVLLASPPRAHRVDTAALARTTAAACEEALREGIAFVQAVLPPNAQADVLPLSRAGFLKVAELVYLRRELTHAAPLARPPEPEGLSWRTYDEVGDLALAALLKSTYEQSRDCTALLGLRQVEDILDSHKAAGRFTPTCWQVAVLDGLPAGAVLVNDATTGPAGEVVYMGVAASCRGKGLGRVLIHRSLRQAADRDRAAMTLGVDTLNTYARSIYDSAEFIETHRRTVYVFGRFSTEVPDRVEGL